MGVVYAKENYLPKNVPATNNPGSVEFTDKEEMVPYASSPARKEMNLEGVQARVDKINIDGLSRTKDDIIINTVKDLFKAKDFQEVIIGAHQIRGKLENLGCFRNIGIYIDISNGPDATPHGLEVTFHVRELKRIIGGVNTMVGNNEGSLVLGLRGPNLFGRGEKLQAEYAYGSSKTNTFNLSFIKPFLGKWNPVFTSTIFQQACEWPASAYRQIEKGLLLDLSFFSAPLVRHSIQLEGNIRDIAALTRSAPFAVREQSGPSLKSAVRHILAVDSRDGPIFPTCGSIFQLTSELAGGFGGNIGFMKNEVVLQTNLSVIEDFVLQGAVQGGILNRLFNNKSVNICDQFFLGGPLSVRGFDLRGIGNHVDGISLGADIYWAAALHLYAPLPFKPGKGGFGDLFRSHIFFNCGNIGNFKFSEDYQQNLQMLTKTLRASYGFGIALRLGQLARLELNYCIPVKIIPGDRPIPGIQFGIGMQFL